MLKLSNLQLEQSLNYPQLVDVLKNAFAANYTTPLRHHHNFKNPIAKKLSTLLLMPSWDNENYLGVKLVTISPKNETKHLPTIQGLYLLFDIKTGVPLMQCDARLLTVKRTAAASALASQYLSKRDSENLLMIGTGYLAPHLIEAHTAVRPIKKIKVWGRNFEKAKQVVNQFKDSDFEIIPIKKIQDEILTADIISAATMSTLPLIKGEWLQAGQHLDLVGSYLPSLREADDNAITRSSVYVDNLEGACKETGDILIPIQNGTLKKEDIKGDLFEICKTKKIYMRTDQNEITLFKSVGHALEDLATASYLFEHHK